MISQSQLYAVYEKDESSYVDDNRGYKDMDGEVVGKSAIVLRDADAMQNGCPVMAGRLLNDILVCYYVSLRIECFLIQLKSSISRHSFTSNLLL